MIATPANAAPIERPHAIAPTDQPEAGTFEAIFRALDASSHDVIGPARPRWLVIPIHDDTGTVAGGLWGSTLFQWLFVQLLYLPVPLRGRGFGAVLVNMAEAEARSRGCVGSYVTTFSFQAEPFYTKLGYSRFGVLPDYPPGHGLVHLYKRFQVMPGKAA